VTDDELMRSCRDGSHEAFGQLFERHRAAIWSFFRRRVGDRARAEDLAQDTFVALLKSAPRYEPRDVFRSYLFGIAYNVLSDERRRRPGEARGSDVDPATVSAPATDLDDVLRVRRAISELDPIDRDVVMLREFDALSYIEIAGVLAIPVNTVRSRLFRARMALKETLQ
jgi:RNA polymerase sigma-70 factor, ECF subfamily